MPLNRISLTSEEIRTESSRLKQDLTKWNSMLPDLTMQAMVTLLDLATLTSSQAKACKIISLKRTLEAHQTQFKLENVPAERLIEDTERLIDNETTAQHAHQFQHNLLKYDKVWCFLLALMACKRRLIEEHNAKISTKKCEIEHANKNLNHIRAKLKWYRAYYYLQPGTYPLRHTLMLS